MNTQQYMQNVQQPLYTNPGGKANIEQAGQNDQQNRTQVEGYTTNHLTNQHSNPQTHYQPQQHNYNGYSGNQSDEDDDGNDEDYEEESNDTESELDSLDEYEGGGKITNQVAPKPNQQSWNNQNPQAHEQSLFPETDQINDK